MKWLQIIATDATNLNNFSIVKNNYVTCFYCQNIGFSSFKQFLIIGIMFVFLKGRSSFDILFIC